jgi:hypothetical protein
MMQTIILSTNDNRLGRYNPDGTFASWPEVNLEGGRYTKANAIVLRLAGDYFVVVPPHWADPFEVKIGDPAQPTVEPLTVEPPIVDQDRRKGKGA